jgi:CENP-B-like protein
MRSDSEVREAFRLAELGHSRAEIGRRLGIARTTVRDWLDHGEDAVLGRPMRRDRICTDGRELGRDIDGGSYAYLLGQYLGDGCISTTRGKHRLRIACCDAYPDVMAECVAAIRAVRPEGSVGKVPRIGCTEVYSDWRHWPCLFPQHGPGVKHERPIVLEPWQREIAIDAHPGQLVRGLIHSDGCRCINKVTTRGKRYEYVRYLFSNRSLDIQALFIEACERLGVSARPNNTMSISVARRESVRRLDAIVGPKT